MALYNWLLMLLRVILNAQIEINAYHYTRAHAYTHIYKCNSAASQHSGVMCISLLQLEKYFFIRLAGWSFTPGSSTAEGQRKIFKAFTFLATRGSWTLALIYLAPVREWKEWTPMGACALIGHSLSVQLSSTQTVVLLRGLEQRWDYSLFSALI